MLTACPRLRTLALVSCPIEPSEETPSPVALNHLECLSLESESESYGFVHVFPLLAIGSEGLSMSLTLHHDCDFIDEAKAFFGRTKVTQLHVWGIEGHVPLSMLLYPIPYLETLALDHVDISDDGIHSLVLWPRLRTLYLKCPAIDLNYLQQFVELQHSLKKLRIYGPMNHGRLQVEPMTDRECILLAGSLHGVEDFKVKKDGWGELVLATWDFIFLRI
ncbi:hypothetical protein FRC08_012514 [Ceratobasidium sp. 394]|nr:hypothetical protein FRC08_012514 [Ceratobasidium sp. 394]